MEAANAQRRQRVVPVLSQESVIILIAALVVMSQIAGGMYTPRKGYYRDSEAGLDNGEDDDMDQTASTPKRNRGESKSETPDGYEENEPDGSYDESPREEEGQADLEKFFDDHLGASERDGMDKENLPSNMAELIIQVPANNFRSHGRDSTRNKYDDFQAAASEVDPVNEEAPVEAAPEQPDNYFPNLNRKRQFIKLPTKSVLITKESTKPIERMDDSSDECYECDEPKRMKPANKRIQPRVSGRHRKKAGSGARRPSQEESAIANENNVVAIENDDDDKIYVTNKTNQPFKIDALGGYDPEEDFKSASEDLEDPGSAIAPSEQRRKSKDERPNIQHDIIFNDTDSEGPYEDASETDEVTFNSDNPYKKEEMEDEIKSSASSKRDNKVEGEESNKSPVDNDSEDAVKGWVNDGVEDMDIPSQSHQDIVLEKAARMEELAQERRDKEKEEQALKDNEQEQPDENSQRMPNADYMKNDLDDEFEDT